METTNIPGITNASLHSHPVDTLSTFHRIIGTSSKVHWRSSTRARITCPSHDDRRPSLDVSIGERGLLLKCWAGCRLTDICSALGLEIPQLFFDFFQDRARPQPRPARRPYYRLRTWKERASALGGRSLRTPRPRRKNFSFVRERRHQPLGRIAI